jgi:ectoine hydroxylase
MAESVLEAAMTDNFPTRAALRGAPATPTPRRGRVVRGSAHALAAATGESDAAQRFDRDGYLHLPGFFAAREVAIWHDEAVRLERISATELPPEAFFERSHRALRSLFDVSKFSQMFAALANDPRLLAIAGALLGEAPYLHQTRLNYKPAYHGRGFYWHSDFETWHAEDGMPDMHAVSVSIALTPNTPFNGTLMLIPGSHRTFIPCTGTTPDHHYRASLVAQEIGTPTAAQLDTLIAAGGLQMPTGAAGSIVVFDCNTMHGSFDNLSDVPRINLFFVYNARSNALQAPFAAPRPRPTFIAARPTPLGAAR